MYDSTKRKALQMYKQLGKIVSDTHMHLIKHPKEKSCPVLAEFSFLEQWTLQATEVLEAEEHSWALRSQALAIDSHVIGLAIVVIRHHQVACKNQNA